MISQLGIEQTMSNTTSLTLDADKLYDNAIASKKKETSKKESKAKAKEKPSTKKEDKKAKDKKKKKASKEED